MVAPQLVAAEAGGAALAAGGTAADAAVAAGFVLAVVDPANCGLGGYGGFLVYSRPGEAPLVVDFNTWVPASFDPAGLRQPGDDADPLRGGRSVAPPNVVPGLLAAHAELGRLPLAQLVAPAIEHARDGFSVTRDVARALASHWERTGGGTPELARIFFPAGRPPVQGELLVQPELAATLELLAASGIGAFGELATAIAGAAASDGGLLDPADLAWDRVEVAAPATTEFEGALVHGPPPETSGSGILFAALDRVAPGRLGANRSAAYVDELTSALAAAWRGRAVGARMPGLPHTTTLSAADSTGGIAALTFTHGEWFGSGIVVPGTGIVLNGGANLFARVPGGAAVITNMSPLVVDAPDGTRHAVGATGGPRIPAILLSAVVDIVVYGATLTEAIAAPHLSVRPTDGALQGEAVLLESLGRPGLPIGPGDFGAATGVTVQPAGGPVAGLDPRFDAAAAAP